MQIETPAQQQYFMGPNGQIFAFAALPLPQLPILLQQQTYYMT
jgi:hypothetical protein